MPSGPEGAAEKVVTYIHQQLQLGTLHPGDRLPSERTLAAEFQISRSSVREALKGLAMIGMVEGRPGSGTYVARREPSLGPGSPQEVMEARLAVEPYLASLAAVRARSEEINALEDILHASEREGSPFETLDGTFHLHIAEAARNQFLLHFAEQLQDARSDALWGDLKRSILQRPGVLETFQRQHRNLLTQLRARDAAAAQRAALEHARTVYRYMFQDIEDAPRP